MTVTDQIDEALAPLIIALNKLRQAQDAIPLSVYGLVPIGLRMALDEVFDLVYAYEANRGRELRSRTPAPADQDGQKAEEGNDPEAH